MDPNSLIVHQAERGRLCLVMDAVSKIYGVRINTDAVDTCSKQSKTSETNNTSCSRSEATAVGKLQNERRQAAWNTSKGSSCRPGEALPPMSLLFEADVSGENIEKAKNFVRTHLEPGADYVTCAHKLENLQEFNMVLENSQDIQTSTNALLTFNPECLEVTLQGSQNSIATARSKVVVFLEKLREQACGDTNSTESSESQGKTHHFYDDLLLDNFIENNNVPSEVSHSLTGSGTEDITKSSQRGQVKASDSDTGISRSQHSGVDGKKMQSDLHSLVPVVDSFDDIECDDAKSPVSDVSLSPVFQHVCGTGPDQFVKMSVIASDDEDSCEQIILTEPRYSKKVEQALRLGYTEKHVTKVLARLGPECSLNDMLSELIKLGALDSDPLSGQSLSPEPDVTVAYDIVDFGPHKGHKYSTVNLGTGDSSSADASRSIPADPSDSSNLRDIIIDGSNVAMSHGKKVFSCKGIQLAVSWFRERGHKNITAFVPQWRKETSRPDAPITDQEILSDLEKEGVVVFTPARRVKGRRVVCYDDRYILKLAVVTDGIVVSNDVYRDLVNEKEDFRKVVEQRLLMYSFVSDRFMPPEDPLGRFGPTLDNFLRKIPVEPVPRPQDCPYGKKCTYGNKCRFFHPERGFAPQKSVTETLKEQAELKLQERATRLSEIAEKSRRSKQKLSRTKSLIPWDPVICPFAVDEAKKSEKPKLSHSKSVVYPSKSSDYLNEHRKKLEEAELTAAMEKMSTRDSASEKQVPQQGFFHNTPDKQSKPKSHSPSSSPVPQKDILKQMTTGENLPRNSSPLKSVSTNAPSTLKAVSTNSPSHVTMKKAESPEGYLTGHLYVAKKLSDEGCESSFFSEHSCSPSSTRTSSPVSSAGRITEQKQFLLDAIHKDRQDDISGSFSLPPPFHPALFHHQPPTSAPQTGHHDLENIPNLSIFENELCRDSQRFVGSDLAGHRHISMAATHLPDYLPYKADPCSPDSGLFTSYESLCSPYHNVSEDPLQQFKGYPGSVVEKPHSVSEHMNLRRAFSSTGNIKTSEISHQKLGRWASGFPAVYFGEELPGLKPEQSVPVLDKTSVHMQGHPHGMNRQNSSSDPQIHNITAAADMQDMLSPLFSPLDSARSFQDPFSSHNRQYQVQQLQQKQFENHNQLQRLHMQQQPQSNNLLLSPQLPKPSTDVWGEPVSHPHLRHRSSLGGATQSQYSQLPNPASSYHSTVYQGHLLSHAGAQNVMAAGTYSPSAPNLSQPPPTYHQPAMMYAAQFGQPPPGIYLDARRQSFPSPAGYSPHQMPKGQAFGCPDQHQNVSLIQPASLLIIPPEDAPILPDDPRYLNYYRLKDLFGEPVVRRVMNLNRGELSLDRICNLIIKYKEETGGL